MFSRRSGTFDITSWCAGVLYNNSDVSVYWYAGMGLFDDNCVMANKYYDN